MTATVSTELIAELDAALKLSSAEQRARTLQRLSELLLSCVERLSPSQIGIFDDVLIRLLDCVGAAALANLSTVLADFAKPPKQTLRQLARHQDSAVAAPLLSKSPVLLDEDLIEIAKNRSQQHLVAVAGRQNLSAALTDIILKMAGRDASRALAKNSSAHLSKAGLIVLLAIAKRGETMAESLGLRPDLSAEALRELLSVATATVRARLLKAAPAELRQKIQAELDSVDAQAKPKTQAPINPFVAHAAVAALSRTGKLRFHGQPLRDQTGTHQRGCRAGPALRCQRGNDSTAHGRSGGRGSHHCLPGIPAELANDVSDPQQPVRPAAFEATARRRPANVRDAVGIDGSIHHPVRATASGGGSNDNAVASAGGRA
jgi:uncharacterized protein DUF2336